MYLTLFMFSLSNILIYKRFNFFKITEASNIKMHRHPKKHDWKRHYPSERQDPAPCTRTRTHIPPPADFHQALVQLHPRGADFTTEMNYDLPPGRKETPNSVS